MTLKKTITNSERNSAIGELLCKEKYKFLPTGLVGEICRDFIEEYEKEGEDNE